MQTQPSGQAQQSNQTTSRQQTTQIKDLLRSARDQARSTLPQLQDGKAQALLETTAEVLQGLMKAFEDYEQGTEDAWR